MSASERLASVAVGVAVAGGAAALAGCDALLGLGGYSDVACAFDCDAGAEVSEDASTDTGTPIESGAGGSDSGSADAGGPTPLQIWANWPMPNPDASIAPDSSSPLPHPMAYQTKSVAYDAGAAVVVHDLVTGLDWELDGSTPAASPVEASAHCASLATALGGPWRVPTRIELVSIIDFTREPTLDSTTFLGTDGGVYWTSSAVPSDAGAPARWWTVSFSSGLAAHEDVGAYVRCVAGPS